MTPADGIVGEYLALKEETDADLLAMQVGDFYEFFAEDAETVARELGLEVSQKSSHGSSYPMAGVPTDDLTPYVKQLVERGYRVGIADQHETADGHTRELTRIVTPGTVLATEDADARYLAAIVRADRYGVAFADITTGRFYVTTGDDADDVLTDCYRFDPVEILPGPDLRNDDTFLQRLREEFDAPVTLHETNAFAPGVARAAIREQFGPETIESLGLADPAIRAAGAVLGYVADTGSGVLESITRLQPYAADEDVTLDATTQRNLELTETMGGHGPSLLDVIDHTVTSAGTRLLREWLGRPRRDQTLLARRHASVAAFTEAALPREAIRETLADAFDLERLTSKAVHGSANPHDLLRVRDTLGLLPDIVDTIESTPQLAESPLAAIVSEVDHERAETIREALADALVDDPPEAVSEGGVIRPAYHEELAALVDRYEDAREWLDSLADREKRRHGLTHLQVDRNRTDGFYIQVGKSEVETVPEEYREIKTLKNSKRYTTDELATREREFLRLEEERAALEAELFGDLRTQIADAADTLQGVGRVLATVDVLASLATHAISNGWTRPALTGDGITIEQGRHPVVEQTTEFVPNDILLDEDRRFLIVTGPNMAGKSTYIRQVALITVLAQIGSFVPAETAQIDPVDGIFTRVGALDELAEGRSTFMVEMQEVSKILHSATEDSLVILDEVGRGTATYDGISIAWAATEYLHNEVRAFTLFATHYHELTALAEHLAHVANVHVAAEERDGDITFMRTIREGPTDRSYGIHVAELAGVPHPVVDRARDVLDRLRSEKAIEARGGTSGTQQVVFDLEAGQLQSAGETDAAKPVDPEDRAVLEELRELDLADLTAGDLFSQLEAWQSRLE